MVAFGCFLPWVTASFLDLSMSVSGVDDGRDGVLILPFGIAIAVVGFTRVSKVGLGAIRPAGVIMGLIAVGLAILEMTTVNDMQSDYVSVSIGIGLYVIAIGGVVAALAALVSRN
jgi:hypothetical protein